MLVLSAENLQQLLSMQEAIDAVALALKEYSVGQAVTPLRSTLAIPSKEAVSLFMPSMIESTGSLGVKIVSVFPENKSHGKNTIYGVMILMDPTTGEPLALIEASSMTVLRTGAVCGLATKLLSKEDSKILGLIGTGAQARGIIRAIMAVRTLEQIKLFNRSFAKAEGLRNEIIKWYGKESPDIQIVASGNLAVQGADIIATATNAIEPVFHEEAVTHGAHINAIGSFQPWMQEIPAALVQSCNRIVVESRTDALKEAGDLIIPIEAGLLQAEGIYEIGEIVGGKKPGRRMADELTLFKSVGMAAMDVVVARALYDRAVERGIGQNIVL